ncbi:MAG TPA: FecR domain-containing protein [Longimicrobiaceae bacterium]|nr:FecR domain-containing protein [Longimicrobiaceae bacterium]
MDEQHWQLLVRALSGEASAEEVAELRRWEEADPANAEGAQQMRSLWDAAGHLPDGGDEAAAWGRVRERMKASPPPIPLRPRARPWQSSLLRIAAAVVLVVATSPLWGPPAAEVVHDRVLTRTVTTAKGERVKLTLSDGTRVLLGVESRLRYPRWFGPGPRSVHLQGVAYFEVAHDASRPFRVYTPVAVARVLGTKFLVRDYAGSAKARVVVTEGRVAVRAVGSPSPAPAAVLSRGEAAELPASGAAPVVEPSDVKADLAWTRGTIAFHNAPVRDVIAEIGHWYDVKIEVPDSALAARHLTISFRNEPLDSLLREIATVLNARIERRGSVLILTPAPPARSEAPARVALAGSL